MYALQDVSFGAQRKESALTTRPQLCTHAYTLHSVAENECRRLPRHFSSTSETSFTYFDTNGMCASQDLVTEVERSTELKVRMRRHREEQAKRAKEAAEAEAAGAKSEAPEQQRRPMRRNQSKRTAADSNSSVAAAHDLAVNMGVSSIALLDFIIEHKIDKTASITDVVAVREALYHYTLPSRASVEMFAFCRRIEFTQRSNAC